MDRLSGEKVATIVIVFFAIGFPKAIAVNKVPALFAFGDSILDTGNNNKLITASRSDFPPYGRDFQGGIPTGRFCNGKTPTDLIATALGIKEAVPAYLSDTLSPQDLTTGVCFASSASGFYDLTAVMAGVLTMPAQLGMFKEYIGKLTALVGQQRATDIISNSLFLVSAGINDIAITYYFYLYLTQPFPSYLSILISTASNFFKNLHELGVRKVWVLSTLPAGCLPLIRDLAGGPTKSCATTMNQEAQTFNAQLSSAVDSIRASLQDYDIRFVDVYTPFLDLINNPRSSGFTEVVDGCCGTDLLGISGLCNPLSVCSNPSNYVFWDFGHPTERSYQVVVSSILKGFNVSTSFPVNSISQ